MEAGSSQSQSHRHICKTLSCRAFLFYSIATCVFIVLVSNILVYKKESNFTGTTFMVCAYCIVSLCPGCLFLPIATALCYSSTSTNNSTSIEHKVINKKYNL